MEHLIPASLGWLQKGKIVGTRHLTCVVSGGEYKVAQYGQWDGYPEGAGVGILQFLGDGLPSLKKKAPLCGWIDSEKIKALWVACGADPKSDMVSMDISSKFAKLYPQLHRDVGSNVLQLIADSENGILLKNSIDFANDSLFCEWCYVVDLDKATFEVYEGFNRSPIGKQERFYKDLPEGTEYYPVKQVAIFRLDHLPSESEFIATLVKQEA